MFLLILRIFVVSEAFTLLEGKYSFSDESIHSPTQFQLMLL